MWTYQHHHFKVHQLPVLSDNYIYIIEDSQSDAVLVVDPALAEPVIQACEKLKLTPTHIINTHHHWDHTDGNSELVATYACRVVGNQADAKRIPHINQAITTHTSIILGNLNIQIIDVPGHTLGHIAYVIDDALFCGDTLFGGGCGRLFEGSFEQMWGSLQKLATLDEKTKVYCAHEYTLANLQFAQEVDPNNEHLQQRIKHDTQTRMSNQPTIPSIIALEKQTNPFLRPLNPEFCAFYDAQLSPLEIFSQLRTKKNKW